ncbi:MAG: FAD-dependent oxidoreductase, partial [Candidatus Kapaibacteriales bacterium]
GTQRTNDFFLKSKNIQILTNHECIKIIPERNAVVIRNQAGELFELNYDFLVIAIGSKPKVPPFPIIGFERVMYFHNPLDAKKIRKLAESGILDSVGIIGGGFVGCELAEAFTLLWGINTTVFDCEDYLLSKVFDFEISAIIGQLFEKNGIKLQLCSKIESITSTNNKAVVHFEGKTLDFDYVFLCAGYEPNVELAKLSGIEIGAGGGILVNEYLQTNYENIFAVGDCIEIQSLITKINDVFPLGSLANREGRVVANNIFGIPTKFNGAVGSISIKSFDTTFASAGLNAKALDSLKIPHKSILATFYDKPHSFPGNEVIFAKMTYDQPTGKLFGIQLAGKGEVVRYVDIFAELLRNGASIDDLTNVEHCYTPPHSTPVNPLNNLGYIVQNQRTFAIEQISPLEFDHFDGQILDLRTNQEVKQYPLERVSVHIPYEELRQNIDKLDKNKKILCVCQKGPRSLESAILLKKLDFEYVYYLGGGIQMLKIIF